MYKGTEARSIIPMARYSLEILSVKKSAGIRTDSKAATNMPMTSHLVTS